MKHLIFTRFYSQPFKLTPEQLISDKFLVPGIKHLKGFLLPSLENQTNKNFTLIITIYDKLNELRPDIYSELKKLTASFKIELMKNSDKMKYVESLNPDYLIGSRIDIDDCVFNGAVSTIQSEFKQELDFMFYAFMNGCTMYENNPNDIHKFVSPTYDGWSSFSAFPSIIVNWKKLKLLPFYNHTRLKEFANTNGIELIHNKNHFYNYDVPCAYIYLQHQTNIVAYGHRSNDILNYSKKQIHTLFGI